VHLLINKKIRAVGPLAPEISLKKRVHVQMMIGDGANEVKFDGKDGTLQALLTPDIVADFSSIWFLVFFIRHGQSSQSAPDNSPTEGTF
jgi:hypothetical protein